MTQQTILVTGGLGFIGSHACVELIEAGYAVVIIDNLTNSSEAVLANIETITGTEPLFVEADVRDAKTLSLIFSAHKISAVMHFAGLKAVAESVEKPLVYYQNNVYGSLVLLQAMQHAGVENIIFSSSATVYGEPQQLPITEQETLKPTNPYGQSKLMVENILRDVCATQANFSAVVLRYFNPVGAHKSALIGENPNDIPNNLVPYIVKVANDELPFLSIYGNDYATPDGTGVRDYIHVTDLVQGHLSALDALLNKHLEHWQVFNLGTGKGASVIEVAQAFERVTNTKVATKFVERRAGDIATCYACADKAKTQLNWQTKHSLEDMLSAAWQFKVQQNNVSEDD